MKLENKIAKFLGPNMTILLLVASMNSLTYFTTKYELYDKPLSEANLKLEEYYRYDLAKIMTYGKYKAAQERINELK